jgi:hypothetical protein
VATLTGLTSLCECVLERRPPRAGGIKRGRPPLGEGDGEQLGERVASGAPLVLLQGYERRWLELHAVSLVPPPLVPRS